MKFLLVLLLLPISTLAQGPTVTFSWDPNPAAQQILAYQFRELDATGTNWVTLGSQLANNFSITNYQITGPRTFSVTASNIFGVSTNAAPLTLPGNATPPANLRMTTLSMAVPVPGMVEMSTDLIDWKQRFVLTPIPAGSGVTISQYEPGPFYFMRQKFYAAKIPPPLP